MWSRLNFCSRLEHASRAYGLIASEKVTQRVLASTPKGRSFPAYEIHMGETSRPVAAEAFAWIGGCPEGIRHERCAGTYLQRSTIRPCWKSDWLSPARLVSHDDSYNRLADWFERWAADGPRFEKLFLFQAMRKSTKIPSQKKPYYSRIGSVSTIFCCKPYIPVDLSSYLTEHQVVGRII